jgi:hypothetical protein
VLILYIQIEMFRENVVSPSLKVVSCLFFVVQLSRDMYFRSFKNNYYVSTYAGCLKTKVQNFQLEIIHLIESKVD